MAFFLVSYAIKGRQSINKKINEVKRENLKKNRTFIGKHSERRQQF